ncbi:MAG: helix-turn-helix domain-containing protein [Planctomycetes bacterium]|nr:helix-turn-helix domain-containing protein [Planctomycetota bacterium]
MPTRTKKRTLQTAQDVADRFGVSVTTVRRWVRLGRIPYIRVSRRIVRFDLQEIERVVACNYKG